MGFWGKLLEGRKQESRILRDGGRRRRCGWQRRITCLQSLWGDGGRRRRSSLSLTHQLNRPRGRILRRWCGLHIANSPDSKDFEELVVSADEVVGIASSPDSIDEEIKQMEWAAEIQESEPKISANIDDATSQLESFYLPRDLSVFFVND